MLPTREELIENIKVMERQGAPKEDIQAYLDSLPKPMFTDPSGNKYDFPDQESFNGFKRESGIDRISSTFEKVLKPTSEFLFGTTGKTFGTLITKGIGSGLALFGNSEQQKFGKELEKLPTPTVVDAAFTALELYPGGGIITNSLRKLPGGFEIAESLNKVFNIIPQHLKESAIKQYTQALAPTKEVFKKQAQKVVPGLLERGVTAFTRTGLAQKFESNLYKAGEAIENVLSTIPEWTKIKTSPIIEALDKKAEEFIVKGTKVVAEPEKIVAIDKLKDVVNSLGEKVNFESIRSLRQIWDNTVAKSKGFIKDEVSSFGIEAKRSASNAIRYELGKDFPDLAKVNAEFTFWKRSKEILDETIERTTPQTTPLSQRLMQTAGVTGGFVRSGLEVALLTGELFKTLVRITQSTGWKTVSAVLKNNLANALVDGNKEIIYATLRRITTGIKNTSEE